MTPFFVMMVQDGLTFMITALMAWIYVHPALANKSLGDQVTPLLFVHAFRFVPLALFLPGQVDPAFPADLAKLIAYGDFISGLLALAAILAWRHFKSVARVTTLVFSLVGTGDMTIVLIAALRAGVYNMDLGFIYYIPAFYVPVLAVFQIMIFTYLLKGWTSNETGIRSTRA